MIKPACGGSSRGRFGITMRGTMELDVRVRVRVRVKHVGYVG